MKALCVGTRCASVDHFVSTFSRFCDDDSFFVATVSSRPVGLETAFSIQLADGVPVLRGLCVVREIWSTPVNRFGRPGIRLGIVRLTRESTEVFRRLGAARRAASVPLVPPPAPATTPPPPLDVVASPEPVAAEPVAAEPVAAEPVAATTVDGATTVDAEPIADSAPAEPAIPSTVGASDEVTPPRTVAPEIRTPGSDYVLPANPLMNLTDESLEGFVDCTLYEQTGMFPLDDDASSLSEPKRPVTLDPIEPPLGAPEVAPAPAPDVRPNAPASLLWVVEAPIASEPIAIAPELFPSAYPPALPYYAEQPAASAAPGTRAPIPVRSIVIVTLCVLFLFGVIALVIHERPSHKSGANSATEPRRLLRAIREVVLVHLAQEAVGDRVPGGVSDHRVDPAARTQRRGVRVDPGLDVGRRERAEAEEARALCAGLELHPMARGVLLRGDERSGGEGSSSGGGGVGCDHGARRVTDGLLS